MIKALLGQKLLAAVFGGLFFLFIAIPIFFGSRRQERQHPLRRDQSKVCPFCGQSIREGIFRK